MNLCPTKQNESESSQSTCQWKWWNPCGLSQRYLWISVGSSNASPAQEESGKSWTHLVPWLPNPHFDILDFYVGRMNINLDSPTWISFLTQTSRNFSTSLLFTNFFEPTSIFQDDLMERGAMLQQGCSISLWVIRQLAPIFPPGTWNQVTTKQKTSVSIPYPFEVQTQQGSIFGAKKVFSLKCEGSICTYLLRFRCLGKFCCSVCIPKGATWYHKFKYFRTTCELVHI